MTWRKTPMTFMGEVLARQGSDKSTNHCYDPIYERLFHDRAAVKNVLEIGVSFGGSVLAWRELFPNAVIVGLDLSASEHCPRLDRLEIHQGNQCDKAAVLCAVGGRKFDLIIDDASHRIEHQLLSLFWLWPHLRAGGYYVIEEFDIYSQNGHASPENRDCLSLFRGVQLIDTEAPAGPGEMLVVVRKEPS